MRRRRRRKRRRRKKTRSLSKKLEGSGRGKGGRRGGSGEGGKVRGKWEGGGGYLGVLTFTGALTSVGLTEHPNWGKNSTLYGQFGTVLIPD